MARGHQTAAFPSTVHCGFISLPISWAQGFFLAMTGRLLFANDWVILSECWITLSAMEEKQEAWLIDVVYSPSPSGFSAAEVKSGGLFTSRGASHWYSKLHKGDPLSGWEAVDVLWSNSIKESVSNLLDYTPWPATPNPLLHKSRVEFFLLSLLLTGLLTQACLVLCGKARV